MILSFAGSTRSMVPVVSYFIIVSPSFFVSLLQAASNIMRQQVAIRRMVDLLVVFKLMVNANLLLLQHPILPAAHRDPHQVSLLHMVNIKFYISPRCHCYRWFPYGFSAG